jgi:hypothetical protein
MHRNSGKTALFLGSMDFHFLTHDISRDRIEKIVSGMMITGISGLGRP